MIWYKFKDIWRRTSNAEKLILEVLEADMLKTAVAVPQFVRCKEFKVQSFLKGLEFIEKLCCCKFVKIVCVHWCQLVKRSHLT